MYQIIAALTLVVFLPTLTPVQAQSKATLSGYVKDKQTGEELIGVNVFIKKTGSGAATNAYGFFSITLAADTYEVVISYVGYQTQTTTLELTQDRTMNFLLEPDASELEEVVVSAKAEDVDNMPVRTINLDISQLKKMPSLLGEPDLIKMVQMMPGVITAAEGTSSYFVRGGGADQNLIFIDEAPIYDPSHLLGLISVFNSDVIKESELYRGGIPANFGGRLSSIMEVRTKDGNNQKFGGTGGIGTLSGRLALEGPIVKDKGSFLLSARRSFIDGFQALARANSRLFFHDYNLKLNWKSSASNRFFVSAYSGRDQLKFNDFDFGWGNNTVTLRWNHLFSPRLFSNTSIIGSQFDYKLTSQSNSNSFQWQANVREASLKQDFTYFLTPNTEVDFGYQGTLHLYNPGNIRPTGRRTTFAPIQLRELQALDHNLYTMVKHNFEKWKVAYGIRLSLWQQMGPGEIHEYLNESLDAPRQRTWGYASRKIIKSYFNPEPRLSVRYNLAPNSSIHTSFQRMVQNSHLINVGTIPLPFNTWYPSGYYLKPQTSQQITLGYNQNLRSQTWFTGVEVYYKDMDNVTDFADRANVLFNPDLPRTFRQGKSWSYGVELTVEKKVGTLTGFMNYTWSKTDRKVSGVNEGDIFPANYDRRHSFNLNAAYTVNEKWSLAAAFNFATGRPITLPSARYELDGLNLDFYGARNSLRLPNSHRLDLSATLYPKGSKTGNSFWVFSIYNVYGQKNPFSMYTRVAQDNDGNVIGDGSQKEARLTYFFRFLPSITYNFKF